ncbi:LicD family protein [Actinobacillus capsulatus]|uniref:LicD family protein n=1 Tax=Actinobacillus capsulatus TaxID=717 RepID=UPI000477B388|nr:LicD family protein [Actinobacillus capsulatus]
MFQTLQKHLPSLQRVLRESNSQRSLLAYWYGLHLLSALERADHSHVRKIANKMLNKGINIGYYFLAQSYFLCGEYSLAEQAVKKITNFAKVPEAVFLYADILVKCQRQEEAWQLLEQCALLNKRKKVWIHLANLVNTAEDYQRLDQRIEQVRTTTSYLKSDLLIHPRTNAALRAGLTETALALSAKQTVPKQAKFKKKKTAYNDKSASIALADLKKVLDQHKIPFFLISGTLLGCIREGKLLGHDKDIDVGVWDDHSYEELANYLATSGYFYVVPTRTKHLVMLRHVNGIVIDVFIHYREPNDYWHAGVKIKWHNSPFNLVYTHFLGQQYLIPENYDLYLTENYGDWRTPKTKFDSAFDTPNMEVINEAEMKIYRAKIQK